MRRPRVTGKGSEQNLSRLEPGFSGTGFSGEQLPDKWIGMTRMHLEEDPGKSTHFSNCTGLDFNMRILQHP